MVYDDLRALLGEKKKYGEILNRLLFRTEPRMKFSEAWPVACAENGVQSIVTLKVNAQQLPAISRAIETDEVQSAPILPFDPEACDAFFGYFQNSIWVHLVRTDVLAQTVSHYMARNTGVWHARAHLEPSRLADYNDGVAYDFPALLSTLREIDAQRHYWPTLFARHAVTPFSIVYEAAVDDYPAYWQPLFGASGLKAVEPAPARREVQLANGLSAEFRERFERDLRERVHDNGPDAPWLEDLLARAALP